ncbi:MAG TPA: ATPase domain-containing protein, partial [Gaiellaceae bacterium]|nr:ATPase domain-containing protein [Gaiellaceae bacterium]
DPDALGERVEFLHLADLVGGDDQFGAISEEILRRGFEAKPAVIVVDSSKALHDVVEPEAFRRALYDLASKIAYSNAVLILVGEYSAQETRTEPEFAVADGILQLENESRGPVDRRWLRVLKMRGAEVAPGQHSFQVCAEGVQVFPRLETTLPKIVPTLTSRAAFGLPRLDEAIGGGIPRGDATLLVGPSGVGKTLLALRFIAAGIEQGERCLHISFQESEAQVKEKAAAAGWNWKEVGEDQLVVRHIPPVELNLDEVGALVRRELDRGEVKRVVVDSLAELAFAARETERLPGYVWALGGYVRAAGGTTIFTNEMAALGQSANLDALSFIFNNVYFLRYVESNSELHRALNVLKMRESAHEKGALSYTIDENGLTFGGKIEGLSGLLGWSALRGGDPSDQGS